jgi:hypothetical protein
MPASVALSSRENLLAQALAASRPEARAMFDDVHDTAGPREAAQALWEAMTVGEQSGPVRMLLQLLSLAATDPEQYGDLAADSVEVMIGPIAAAYVRPGHPPQQARAGPRCSSPACAGRARTAW